jgi:hypothetical protein
MRGSASNNVLKWEDRRRDFYHGCRWQHVRGHGGRRAADNKECLARGFYQPGRSEPADLALNVPKAFLQELQELSYM